MRTASGSSGRFFDPKLGVYASPRLVADGETVPRGGGAYLVGRPYTIGGHAYYPNERPEGYVAAGVASWYGDAFHGRRTANGEIFDKNSITAAHPTLPLPSYVRVTNTGNGRSMIVRVNDRGPYHGGRVMDVSQRVAENLDFKGQGTAHIRVEYVGRASLGGSDDEKLLATLRMDGGPAQLDGTSGDTMVASEEAPGAPSPAPAPFRPAPPVVRVARAESDPTQDGFDAPPTPRWRPAPVPPSRPYDFDPASASSRLTLPKRAGARVEPPPGLVSFAASASDSRANLRYTRPHMPPSPWRGARYANQPPGSFGQGQD